MSPVDVGFPITRPRQYSILVHKQKAVLKASWDEFFSLFLREVKGSASLLLGCSQMYTRSVMTAKASIQGRAHLAADGELPQVADCLPQSHRKNAAA